MAIDGGLRAIFRAKLREVDWCAIEIAGLGRGIPDLNGCYQGIEIWIELKQTAHWAFTMRPEQIGWIERRVRHGGRVFIAVRKNDELWILKSDAARFATLKNLPDEHKLFYAAGGPARWFADGNLLRLLFGNL